MHVNQVALVFSWVTWPLPTQQKIHTDYAHNACESGCLGRFHEPHSRYPHSRSERCGWAQRQEASRKAGAGWPGARQCAWWVHGARGTWSGQVPEKAMSLAGWHWERGRAQQLHGAKGSYNLLKLRPKLIDARMQWFVKDKGSDLILRQWLWWKRS